MKKRRISKKILVVVGVTFFLVGVSIHLFAAEKETPRLPTPGMQPKPDLTPTPSEKMKEKPKVGPIYISGNATALGRGFGGITIKLIVVRDGSLNWIKDVETNKAGYYSTPLGKEWFNKTVKLVPKHPQFGEGEYFSPAEDRFQITNAKMDNRNFRYTGPLPDLVGVALDKRTDQSSSAVPSFSIYIQATVKNQGGGNAGPFKVKVRFDKRVTPITPGPGSEEKFFPNQEIILDFPSLPAGSSTLQEKVVGGSGPSGIATITLKLMQIDPEDSVIESNEGNNIFTP